MTQKAYICDAIRTPFGRYGGGLATIRTDDLAALPLTELQNRNPSVIWDELDDVILGCANQAGEDNRNVARMAALLSGLPTSVGGVTVNRLCASSLEATAMAARTIKAGEAELIIAGGVESMSRAPLVMAKAQNAYDRSQTLQDTTLGWRFINPAMRDMHGVDSMAETAENVADDYAISRGDQDAFALRSQQRAQSAIESGVFKEEVMPVKIQGRKGESYSIDKDEHPRAHVSLESLTGLRPIVRPDGCVTAGNASGINDGACAVLMASEVAVKKHKLRPLAHVVAAAVSGVEPRVMGIGPVSAVQKLLKRTGLSLEDISVIELNEAFAAQALAVTRQLGIADDAGYVNPNGGAIALGHPLGASGARLVMTAMNQLVRQKKRYAICTMCVGVGQGMALLLENVSEIV